METNASVLFDIVNTQYIAFKRTGQPRWRLKGRGKECVHMFKRHCNPSCSSRVEINVKSVILSGVRLEEFLIISELVILIIVSHGTMMEEIPFGPNVPEWLK